MPYITDKMLSAVVVCYRDEGNIPALYERLAKSLAAITPHWEIVYVNDASPDKSEEILRGLAATDPHLTVINQARNFGAQAAFTAGMVQAMGDAVILMDGDLQDPPEVIPEFVQKWKEGFDVVYGVRRRREKSMGRLNEYLYHQFYVLFNKLSIMRAPVDAGEFSLIDRKAVDWMNALPERDRLLRGLRAWVGFKQVGVSYVRPERYWGKSTNSFWKNLRWAKRAIFSFSYLPLEWISFIALFVTGLAGLAIVIYILLSIFYPAPRGFMTTLVIVLFLGAVQLLSLGVIAEYLAKIFEEVKQRPRYITREIINDHRKGDSHQ